MSSLSVILKTMRQLVRVGAPRWNCVQGGGQISTSVAVLRCHKTALYPNSKLAALFCILRLIWSSICRNDSAELYKETLKFSLFCIFTKVEFPVRKSGSIENTDKLFLDQQCAISCRKNHFLSNEWAPAYSWYWSELV